MAVVIGERLVAEEFRQFLKGYPAGAIVGVAWEDPHTPLAQYVRHHMGHEHFSIRDMAVYIRPSAGAARAIGDLVPIFMPVWARRFHEAVRSYMPETPITRETALKLLNTACAK